MNPYGIDFDKMVDSIEVYPSGLAVVNRRPIGHGEPTCGDRKPITELTAKARTKMLSVLLKTNVEFNSMITLTYPSVYPTDGKEVKSHFKKWLRFMGEAFLDGEGMVDYFWFIEFQKRGAPHFHILVSDNNGVDGPTWSDRAKMSLCWCKAMGLVSPNPHVGESVRENWELLDKVYRVHSHKMAWEAIREHRGAIRYATKYALKVRQKFVPENYSNVGRFWGCSKGVRSNVADAVNINIDGPTLKDVLIQEGHVASGFDTLPKYLFGSKSIDMMREIMGEAGKGKEVGQDD